MHNKTRPDRRSSRFLALLSLAALGAGCQTARRDPRMFHPNTQVFSGSCDSTWTQAIRVISGYGFRLMANDRAAGLASFIWVGGQSLRTLADDPVQLAVERPGSPRKWKDLQVESALLALKPGPRRCEARIAISYTGYTERFWRGSRVDLDSTGLAESRLLAELASSFNGRHTSLSGHRIQAARAKMKPVATEPTLPAVPAIVIQNVVVQPETTGGTPVYRIPTQE